jgi:hypothetical protein
LGHRDHPDIVSTPLREQIDPILLPPREPIELPHHHGGDGARANRSLEAHKRGTTEALAAFDIFKPLHCSQVESLVGEPAREFGLLALGLLGPRRDPAIAGDHTAASSHDLGGTAS